MNIRMIYKYLLMLIVVSSASAEGIEDTETLLNEAHASYLVGEKAKTIAERKAAFNKSLALYSYFETKYNPNYGNGKLFYDIGNNYFQLGEYPEAIYYYYKSLKLMPRNEEAQDNLNSALQKAGIPSATLLTLFERTFFFHNLLSLPERFQLFFVLSVLLIGLICAYIWKASSWNKKAIILVAICCACILLSIGYTRYFSPIDAVIVRSTLLYRDAGEQYAKVSDQPIEPGNKVRVLEILQGGLWLKVITPNGDLGYISYSVARII